MEKRKKFTKKAFHFNNCCGIIILKSQICKGRVYMKKFLSLFLSLAMFATLAAFPVNANVTVAAVESFSVEGCYGWNEYAYAKFSGQASEVYYKKSSDSIYTKVDSQLIRNAEGRVDIPGLAKNTEYTIKLVGTDGTTVYYDVTTKAYDRSGYAFFNHSGVGAYNDDGTLKSNADVIYVTNETKNTVKYNNFTGIGNILKNASKFSNPVAVRIIGKVDSQVRDADGTKATDIANGVVQIDGLTDKVMSNDSYFNMLDISNAKNGITIEGIGDDANIDKWGLMFKNGCQDIEVRNLTFTKTPEDACSTDSAKYFWLHNSVFNRGENKYDLTTEKDKGDGDGSTDMSSSSNITIAYCTYNNTHKTSLNGGSDDVKSYNYTYHHNYFNTCDSRLPLTRQVNLHMYNNYFYNCSTCIDSRASALVLSENQYFENSRNCYKTTANTKYGNPSIKAVGDYLSSDSKYTNTIYMTTNAARGDAFAAIGNKNANPNFDTNSSVFYYKNGASDVELMNTAEEAKTECLTYSGVLADSKAVAGSVNTNPDEGDTTVSTETSTETTTVSESTETTTEDDGTITIPVTPEKTFEPAGVVPDGTVDVIDMGNGEYLLQDNATNASCAWNNTFESQKKGKVTVSGQLTASGKLGSKWSFCRVKGIDSTGAENLIAAFSTDPSKMLALRTQDGGTAVYTSSTVPLELDKTYNYKFVFDLDNKTVELTIDDIVLTSSISVSEISSVYFVTATADTERSLAVTSPKVSTVKTESFVYGDATNDGVVTSADSAILMQKVLLNAETELEKATNNYMKYLDVDKSGEIASTDAAYILQKSLDSTFKMPCE